MLLPGARQDSTSSESNRSLDRFQLSSCPTTNRNRLLIEFQFTGDGRIKKLTRVATHIAPKTTMLIQAAHTQNRVER